MEKQLTCGLKLSLKQLALRRVAANVWNEADVLALIENYRMRTLRDDCINVWRETVEDKVKDKILELVLPETLKMQMIQLVRPMGSDTLRWKRFHEKALSNPREFFNMRILEQLCRTRTGAIDYRKTAEQLVRLEILEVMKRYKLACLYCLVDYIPVLLEELPQEFKTFFCDTDHFLPITTLQMTHYWAIILKGDESKLDHILGDVFGARFCPFAFECSARRGNKAATKYFYQKLTNEERDSYLFTVVYAVIRNRRNGSRCLGDFAIEKLADILYYLLSLMSPEQQMKVLKEHPLDVLNCFLDWPWQDLFLDIADIIWVFLPESSYDELLSLIIPRVKKSGYYFPNFFQKFFLRSPNNFRKHFVCQCVPFLSEIFNAGDTETIKVVFRNLDVEDRVRLVSGYNFFELLNGYILKDKWHLVELCLREATLSKEDRERLKETFMGFLTEIDTPELRLSKHKWKLFFESLGETDDRALNKRSSESEALTRTKKNFIDDEKETLPRN